MVSTKDIRVLLLFLALVCGRANDLWIEFSHCKVLPFGSYALDIWAQRVVIVSVNRIIELGHMLLCLFSVVGLDELSYTVL